MRISRWGPSTRVIEMHTTAVFQQHTMEVHIFTIIKQQQPSSLLLVQSLQKLYGHTPPSTKMRHSRPLGRRPKFTPPDIFIARHNLTNPIMLLEHGFYKYKRVGEPETPIQKNLCTPIFIAALFTAAKC